MKRAGLTWFGIVLAFIAAGAITSIFVADNYVGGPIVAAIFAAGAWRAWYLAGEPSTKPPTEVGG
jgi:hypothetical protein